ncbi:MAG: hypothetical protein QXT06_05795 [Candidatus Bathyarchaeia archaeon]
MKAIITTKTLSNLLSYKNMENETGGFLNVLTVKIKNEVLYIINELFESTKKANAVSAVISSNSPHIWHLHPKNFGAFLSQTDKEDIIRAGALQALTLNGMPPLSLVASFHNESVKDEVFHNTSGLAVNRVEGEILEVRCYIAIPDERCFNVNEIGRCIDNNLYLIDEAEGFIIGVDDKIEGFISYRFVEDLFAKYSLEYPNSLLSILRCLSGIYSSGISPDPIDLMRALCLFNILERFGINKDKAIILKTGSGTKFVVSLTEEVGFLIREIKTYVIEDDLIKILQAVGD